MPRRSDKPSRELAMEQNKQKKKKKKKRIAAYEKFVDRDDESLELFLIYSSRSIEFIIFVDD